MSIYIPLCFYFIDTKSYFGNMIVLHLHSTMLLLYLRSGCDGMAKIRIYIPLCFYFIRPQVLQVPSPQVIYIPLCFYFIKVVRPIQPVDNVIYIPLCFYFIEDVTSNAFTYVIFTFHYASTLSEYPIQRLFPGMWIYIPLCFYFIWVYEPAPQKDDEFTFHYASTLSSSPPPPLSGTSAFTFHYASTLSVWQNQSARIKRNLHSTMLLLYHGLPGIRTSGIQNLHSTMLLLYPVPVFPFYFLQYKYTFCLPHFLHISLLKNLPPPTLQNLNFP